MIPILSAQEDPTLGARLVRGQQLLYAAGPDDALDRPAHVRSGSGIAWINGHLAVVQDDANFVALLDPADMRVDSLTLPPGPDGRRQFDNGRGNKRFKLDLEACVTIQLEDGELLLAFGSGSSPLREQIVALRWPASGPEAEIINAATLYAQLRADATFAGSELNIEGTAWLGNGIRLFQRGNGASTGAVPPLDASCDLPWPALWAYLQQPERQIPPSHTNVTQYQLGSISGQRLTFTDALAVPNALLFLAAAEDTPDAIQDGPVVGSALGIIDAAGVRWAPILNSERRPFASKFEGLALSPSGSIWAVMDRDDPLMPTELWELELTGSWPLSQQ